jgi:hypothetical protein
MLDDFGTGYSSLSNLQLFPFDLVKIDCPFVDSRGVFQANMSMVAAMIQLAGSLDLTAIAEIVEGEAAAASLKAMGCRYGQGYFFCAPIEAEAALQRLRSQVSFEPAQSPANTMITSPPSQDGSQTLIMRRLQDPSVPGKATAETVIVRSLEADGSRAVIIGSGRQPANKEPVKGETVVVRQLEETMVVRPLEETKVVRTAEEDTSSTVMLPAELIGRPYRGDADEDDDDDE